MSDYASSEEEHDAMPPHTHHAIKPCCLICGHGVIDMTPFAANTHATCEIDGFVRRVSGNCGGEMTEFKLRDFGYPVRTVEVE